MSRISSSPFEAVLRQTRLTDGRDDDADGAQSGARVRSTPWYVPQTSDRDAPAAATDAARLAERYMADAEENAAMGAAGEALPEPRSLDPVEIAAELDLADCASIEALRLRRRRFAQANHPDMLHASLRTNATERMMIANRLIDREIARRRGLRIPN